MASAAVQPVSDSISTDDILPQLITWYSSIPTVRIDIHGDFAGSELFLVQGDTLVRHVLTTAAIKGAAVDMNEGWQILHAIALVESFLANLEKRGCKFLVVFFDTYKQISVPPSPISNSHNRYKFIVARECIVEHLKFKTENNNSEQSIYTFKSPTDGQFEEFLNKERPYFILCHDHGVSPGNSLKVDNEDETNSEPNDEAEKIVLLSFIWKVMKLGYTVGLVNEVEFVDTKVFTHLIAPWEIEPSTLQLPNLSAATPILGEDTRQIEPELEPLLTKLTATDLKGGDAVILLTLASIQLSAHSRKDIVSKYSAPFLLHASLLPYLSLSQRHLPSVSFKEREEEVAEFLKVIGQVMLDLLGNEQVSVELRKLSGGIGDLIDGRLFRNILAGTVGRNLDELVDQCPEKVKLHYTALKTSLLALTEQQFPLIESNLNLHAAILEQLSQSDTNALGVLPFSHPVFNPHLKDLDLPIDSMSPPQTRYEKALYETSLSGAAMRRLKRSKTGPTENYRPSEKKKWWQLKGEQLHQANMLKYASSLAGTGGIGLTPERIITANPSDRKKAEVTIMPTASEKKEITGKNKNVKINPKAGGKGTSSKAAEIIAANAAAKAAKAGKKAPDVWKQYYTSEVASSKTDRAKVTTLADFIQRSSDENFTVEARLLKCSYLFNIWRDEYCSANDRVREGYEIIALLFTEAAKIVSSSALTKQIKTHLDAIFTALDFVPLALPAGASSLPSKPPTVTPPAMPISSALLKTKVGMNSLEFQLQYCGPYMDRNLDSSEDPRVRFKPDRWQVNVLDALDADKSVFVVAPTSAGKTFIAYYAMEKTIRTSDDDVLVYIAPTKPLVNQIAAELQARFVKDYPKQPGKTVWAVHAGEYTIHNPQKCQVLVTVPQILLMMLLAPALAATWAPRVKRIILDEIHCIGQSRDGDVWEQLLLLTPCPIVALSATVGNPGEFHQWLQATQAALKWKNALDKNEKVRGVDMVMIHHKHRFNNLRTFYYRSLPDTANRPFKGLEHPKTYSLGLADLESSKNFKHLHPVAALGDDAGIGIPEDLELEARDCYSLYKAMEKAQTTDHPLPAKLAPSKEWFPEVIKKADVIIWEAELKAILKEWMLSAKNQFLNVVGLLRSDEILSGMTQEPSSAENSATKFPDHDVKVPEDIKGDEKTGEIDQLSAPTAGFSSIQEKAINETLDLLSRLHTLNALPALLFSYDRSMCDALCSKVVEQLATHEKRWRETSKEWKRKVAEKELYMKRKEEADRKSGKVKKVVKKKGGEDEQDDIKEQKEMDSRGDDGSAAIAAFDPDAPSEQFSFAGRRNITKEDLEIDIAKLKRAEIADEFIEGLRRGVGIHHGGLSRTYRECVERLFRKGYLRVVIATGTLSLGINMPCATVVFVTDNVNLTPLTFRQAAGRAGRRGFDLLGNVIFHGLSLERTRRLINSNLPSLMGHFPTSSSLILRIFRDLYGSENAPHAASAVNAFLSQTQLSLTGGNGDFSDQVTHHIRFSIEYLRRMNLLSATGETTNFAALVAHLYDTEPSNFLFHALLRSGVFHDICAPLSLPGAENIDSDIVKQDVYKKLMLVLAHLFGRIPYRKSDDVESFKANSHSMVILPDLPKKITEVWDKHNQESLKVFTNYAVTYGTKTSNRRGGKLLPYSHAEIGLAEMPTPDFLKPLEPTHARSPFVALSGYTDEFNSIPELESTCRSDILLESAGVPYLPSTGIKLNAYLCDFFYHGSPDQLVASNRLRKSTIWFILNDFSIALATIVAVLKNLLNVGPEGETRMGDLITGRGVGEDVLEEVERMAAAEPEAGSGLAAQSATAKSTVVKKKAKANWFDEEITDDVKNTDNPTPGRSLGFDDDEDDEDEEFYADVEGEGDTERQSLLKVLKGFVGLQQEFNNKFRATFATKKDAARAKKKLLEAQKAANPTMVKEKKPRLKLR